MKENGFEYVDLGLPSGTMWATCNVGADKPEDLGLLFQFGLVDGYKYGDENNQFRVNDQNKQDIGSALIPLTTSGKTYNMGETLNLKDDAAHVHMGGKWRIPTKNELKELFDNTTYDVATINGVLGMLFTSNINNKRLFVPFAGYWYNGSFGSAGSNTYVWSSQVHPSYVDSAYSFYCDSSSNACITNYYRSLALSVRGVFNK